MNYSLFIKYLFYIALFLVPGILYLFRWVIFNCWQGLVEKIAKRKQAAYDIAASFLKKGKKLQRLENSKRFWYNYNVNLVQFKLACKHSYVTPHENLCTIWVVIALLSFIIWISCTIAFSWEFIEEKYRYNNHTVETEISYYENIYNESVWESDPLGVISGAIAFNKKYFTKDGKPDQSFEGNFLFVNNRNYLNSLHTIDTRVFLEKLKE